MSSRKAIWHKLASAEILERSSQTVSVISGKAYVFGGELRPREPRDNDVHVVSVETAHSAGVSVSTLAATQSSPTPRVGAASTTLRGKMYLFSGRGGVDMAPVEERGSLWVFDPMASTWESLLPFDSSRSVPPPRSYHALTNDGGDILYLHAGCPAKGRLSDLWAFNLSSKQWKELRSAPEPARGGTSIAFSSGKLYRMNGFDGKTEQGGKLDVYEPTTDRWSTVDYTADGVSGPEPRSVSALVAIRVDGRDTLWTLFGERDPSALGHSGAGKMLGDVWVWDIAERVWSQVQVSGDEQPQARGWFAADSSAGDGIIVQGGLGESNERLGDIWMLQM